METDFKKSESGNRLKAYQTSISTCSFLQNTNKKGLTTSDSCKPLLLLVGGTGIEPVASTV